MESQREVDNSRSLKPQGGLVGKTHFNVQIIWKFSHRS